MCLQMRAVCPTPGRSSSCRRSLSARWRSTAGPSTPTSPPGSASCCSDCPPSGPCPPPSSSSCSSCGSWARFPSRPWSRTCWWPGTSSGRAPPWAVTCNCNNTRNTRSHVTIAGKGMLWKTHHRTVSSNSKPLLVKFPLPIDGDIQLGFRRFNARQRWEVRRHRWWTPVSADDDTLVSRDPRLHIGDWNEDVSIASDPCSPLPAWHHQWINPVKIVPDNKRYARLSIVNTNRDGARCPGV